MKLCIFCSANNGIDPDFFKSAENLGAWAAKNGHSIVFGGHDAGLMHAVSKAAKEAGGQVIGVVPRKIEEMGRTSPYLDVHIPTEDLTDRKQLMADMSDAFIVLPGGIGTLDELIETLTLAKLDIYKGQVIALNIDGFFNPLIALLDHYVETGMLDSRSRSLISFPQSVAELNDLLR